VGYTVARIFAGYALSEPFESEWWYDEYKVFNLSIYFVYIFILYRIKDNNRVSMEIDLSKHIAGFFVRDIMVNRCICQLPSVAHLGV
jgi:hypothetical protein